MAQPDKKKTSNTTHQQQIARALHRATGCGYQEALRRVTLAAREGLFPPSLDKAGRETAVQILVEQDRRLPGAAQTLLPGRSRVQHSCDTSWPEANRLTNFVPGTVTALVSLPTVGRSTLALNIALHNAEQGRACLFTSGEIQTQALQEKVVAAKYGVDMHSGESAEGWKAFKARAIPEVEALDLALHGAMTGSLLPGVFETGRAVTDRRGRKLDLWVLDTIQHFSQFSEGGLNVTESMLQVRRIAEELHIAVLVTAKVLTETEAESVGLEHVPSVVAKHADTVLSLHRDGAYWTNGESPNEEATLTLLKPDRASAPACALVLEPERCRFNTPLLDLPSGSTTRQTPLKGA